MKKYSTLILYYNYKKLFYLFALFLFSFNLSPAQSMDDEQLEEDNSHLHRVTPIQHPEYSDTLEDKIRDIPKKILLKIFSFIDFRTILKAGCISHF